MKNLLMTTIAIFGLALISNAQVPNYVPTNGLVSAYIFNGNANNVYGNGTNGIVNNAILTSDRFGNSSNAYQFNSSMNSNIDLGVNPGINSIINNFTFSYWINKANNSDMTVFASYSNQSGSYWRFGSGFQGDTIGSGFLVGGSAGVWQSSYATSNSIQNNNWYNITIVRNNNNLSTYINSILVNSSIVSTAAINNPNAPFATTKIGYAFPNNPFFSYFNGKIDDLFFYNRVLSNQEIIALYSGNCFNNTTITPQASSMSTGGTAIFSASTLDSSPNYIWQSDFGQGYVTLNNYGNYSGVNTNSLSISNIQLSEHNQPIRVISTSGECIDTSNVATINITDTCIVTINDTITTLTSVIDTLIISTLITGLTPPNNLNTIKVFPNPANSHITIDFGNFASMNGYTLKITNSIGQTVFTTPVNQQSSYVDLSTWGGNGIYFVQIIDSQNNTIENRKIVLQ